MTEALVVGIIADTSNPAVTARLLGDLTALAATDPGLRHVEAVVLENSSGEPRAQASFRAKVHGITIHQITRERQESDAARGCFGHTKIAPGQLPIAGARTLVQRYASERAMPVGASVWILDEDLRLGPLLDSIRRGEPLLSERVRQLRAAGVDVAIGPIAGAPPLPARSSLRVNLEDLHRHIELIGTLEPNEAWPDRSAENAGVRASLPEYYYDLSRAHTDAGAHPMWFERAFEGEAVCSVLARLAVASGGLLHGVPVTRTIVESPAEDALISPLARGGNTLVLEPSLLAKLPNVAPFIRGRVSRRSDMLWARLATTLEGARFARAPIPAFQDRSSLSRSSFNAGKLLDDARGSALVLALDALIAEEALGRGRPLDRDAVSRASALYASRAKERLAIIQRSEERVHDLLDQITMMLQAPLNRHHGLLHPAHATSVERLLGHVIDLGIACRADQISWDPDEERPCVEKFFLNLKHEIAAYRAAPSLSLEEV